MRPVVVVGCKVVVLLLMPVVADISMIDSAAVVAQVPALVASVAVRAGQPGATTRQRAELLLQQQDFAVGWGQWGALSVA